MRAAGAEAVLDANPCYGFTSLMSSQQGGSRNGIAPAEGNRAADLDVVARCRSGDVSAFEEVYQRHAQRLYNLAWRMVGNPTDAEDLLQDIFLTAFRKLSTFKGDAALGTWLYRLGVNLCLDRLRSKGARNAAQTGVLDDDTERQLMRAPRLDEKPISRLDLERAIGQLPEGCRAAFLLHDVEGFEHREIASILGVAEGTSKSQVHKARLRIRHYLAGQTGTTGPEPGAAVRRMSR